MKDLGNSGRPAEQWLKRVNARADPKDLRRGGADILSAARMKISSLKNEKKSLEFKDFHGFAIA
jgi:hypothetical protein